MDFQLAEEQALLVETVRTFAEREVLEHVPRWDRDDQLPEQHIVD